MKKFSRLVFIVPIQTSPRHLLHLKEIISLRNFFQFVVFNYKNAFSYVIFLTIVKKQMLLSNQKLWNLFYRTCVKRNVHCMNINCIYFCHYFMRTSRYNFLGLIQTEEFPYIQSKSLVIKENQGIFFFFFMCIYSKFDVS